MTPVTDWASFRISAAFDGGGQDLSLVVPFALSEAGLITIVGILVSGLVGPTALQLWAGKRQSDDHRHDRELRRIQDLAALLDEAADVLAPGVSRLRDANASGTEIPAWAEKVHGTCERLRLRLPRENSAVRAYGEASEALVAVASAIESGDAQAAEQAIQAFEDSRGCFLDSARLQLYPERK